MGCCVCIPQDRVYLIETCGSFTKEAKPGFHCLPIPCICSVAGQVSTRILPLKCSIETKTKDCVFITARVTVQYKVIPGSVGKAFYTLADPEQQIRSHIFDVVRATIPLMTLDEVFASRDKIGTDVLDQLREIMSQYGFDIVDALVTDIQPDANVRASMNEINASRRLRQAAIFKSEALKIQTVKAAEAEAESQHLQGIGVARQRRALVEGIKNAVEEFHGSTGVHGKAAMNMILVSQYLDTLKDIVKQPGSRTIFYTEDETPEGRVIESIRMANLQARI